MHYQITGNYNKQTEEQMQKFQSDLSKEGTEDFGDQIRSIGSWSFNQNLLYVIFLQKNKLVMISKKKRRNLRVFDQMSEFISTRNSLQCRSHHQKLLQKFGEIKHIISNFKKYITKEQYKRKFQELFGKNKNNTDTTDKCQVKEEAFSQEEAQQSSANSKPNFPLIVQPIVSDYQLVYNQYLAQLNKQLISYPLLAYYCSGLQNFS